MLPGDPLSDTNAVIAWLRDDPGLWRRFDGRDKCLSVIAIGEMFYGVSKSMRGPVNRTAVFDLMTTSEVVDITAGVSERYGDLKQQLRAAGKPIPDNDLWIAATAIEHHLVLVTRDKHFELIPGLTVETW